MGENTIQTSSNALEILQGGLRNADSRREVLVTVEEGGCSIKSVNDIVDSTAFLWVLMGGTEV